MINVLLITHKNIASNFVLNVRNIVPNAKLNYLSLEVLFDNSELYYTNIFKKAEELVTQLDTQCLILTDLYGATPSNVAEKLAKKYNLPLVSGLNLGMLIRLAQLSEQYANKPLSIKSIVTSIQRAAKDTIFSKHYQTQTIESN